MNDPVLVIAVIAFTVSLTAILVRQWGRVQIVREADTLEHKTMGGSFAPASVQASPPSAQTEWMEREIDKLREQQVQMRIEIDRLKRPTGAPADG